MPQQQERQRAREPSRDEEIFIIIVKPIPRNCRWQELKDMTRSLGGEQSLKAEVFPVDNGTEMMGHCTIKGRSDAVKVYENMCSRGWNGQRVRVSLSALEKSGSLRTLEGPVESRGIIDTRRAATLPQHASQGTAITANSASHTLYATSTHPSAYAPYNSQYTSMSEWPVAKVVPPLAPVRAPGNPYQSSVDRARQSYLPSTAHTHAISSSSQYRSQYPSKNCFIPLSSTSSISVRPINDGATVFLSGLPYYQSESELRTLLKRFGSIVYLEIHPDSRNPGKNKGTARARYRTSSEALTAVRDLDGRYLRDRKISVKQERDDPSMTATSRRPLRETRTGIISTSKQKKNVAFSSAATNMKSYQQQDSSRGPSRASDRSSGAGSPTGPLVVNGARNPPARRASRGAVSESDSDDSSEDDDSDSDSHTASDDESESVHLVQGMMRRHRL